MISFSSIHKSLRRVHNPLPAVVVACCMAWGAALVLAFDDPGEGDGGGDPTVGTLPMHGGGNAPFDQTTTLRGRTQDIRAAIVDASGDGSVEVVPLGNGEAWVRFYGDVTVELDLSVLTSIEVGIFAGFDGGGMAYAVATPEGLGSTYTLESGYSVALDPIRFANTGLLDESIEIHAFHRAGVRTLTRLERGPAGGTLLIHQDV